MLMSCRELTNPHVLYRSTPGDDARVPHHPQGRLCAVPGGHALLLLHALLPQLLWSAGCIQSARCVWRKEGRDGTVGACYAFVVTMRVLGLFMLPMLPAVVENCAECTYPIPEELSTGLLFVGTARNFHSVADWPCMGSRCANCGCRRQCGWHSPDIHRAGECHIVGSLPYS